MKKEKSNYDYLVELIKDNPEALEFAGSMQDEIDAALADAREAGEDAKEWETKFDNKSDELAEYIEENEEPDFVFEIDCGIGKIEYSTNNMVLEQVMESLGENIKRSNPQAVLNLLDSINTYA